MTQFTQLSNVQRINQINATRKAGMEPALKASKTPRKALRDISDTPITRKMHATTQPLFTGKGKRPVLANMALGETVFFKSSHSSGAQQRVARMIWNYRQATGTNKRFTYRQVTEDNITGYRVWRVS